MLDKSKPNACATSQNAQQVRTTRVRGVSTPPQIKTLTITRSFRTSNFTPLDVGSYCERYNKGPTRNCPCLRALVSSRNVLLSVSLYICVTGSPRRPARLAARQEDTLYHNVSLTRDSEVARAPRSASPPFGNQRPNACMRVLVDAGSPKSPKGTTFASLPHSPARMTAHGAGIPHNNYSTTLLCTYFNRLLTPGLILL